MLNSRCVTRCIGLLHYSTAANATTDSYANYLLHSFGFSQQKALSVSTKLTLHRKNKVYDSKFVENANSVVVLFLNLGFNQTHIRIVVSKRPGLLASNIDKTLKPKIRALQDDDFSRSDIVRVISRHPEILWFGLESTILPAIYILKQVMGSVSNVVHAIERFSKWHIRSTVRCLLPNVALLTTYGVPIELIRKQLLFQPSYYVQNPEVFKNVVMRVENYLGITRDSPMFLHGINLISRGRQETSESKCRISKNVGANQLFFNYLVYHLGFSHRQALSTCTMLSRQRQTKVIVSTFVDNAKSVVTLFRQLGFDDTLIRNIVAKYPRLLAYNVEKTLDPKIKALQEEGFSGFDIIRIISCSPAILLLRMESNTLQAIQILRQVMGSNNNNVIKTLERLGESYFHYIVKCLLRNVALLTSYGVPIELIRKHILYKPKCYVQHPEVFKVKVMRVENKLGITRDSPMFIPVISIISGMTEETFESKFQIFESFGWTQSDVTKLIMRNANCFTFSDERIKKKLYFLMNELEFEPAYLTSRAGFIICSLEKRIMPRHKVLLILKEKGLLKMNPSLYCAIQLSEPCFLKRFVLPFQVVHQAYAKLTGCSVERLYQ